MKLSQFTKISMVVVGIVLLAWIGLLVFSGSGSKKTGPAKVSETECPDCGTRLNKAGDCPKCMSEEGVEAYRAKRANKGFASNPIISIILISLFCLLLVTHVSLVVRKHAKGKRTDVSCYVHCTKCGRKLRYRDTQIGHMGRCPICQKPILFPQPAEEPKTSRWVKIVHYVWG